MCDRECKANAKCGPTETTSDLDVTSSNSRQCCSTSATIARSRRPRKSTKCKAKRVVIYEDEADDEAEEAEDEANDEEDDDDYEGASPVTCPPPPSLNDCSSPIIKPCLPNQLQQTTLTRRDLTGVAIIRRVSSDPNELVGYEAEESSEATTDKQDEINTPCCDQVKRKRNECCKVMSNAKCSSCTEENHTDVGETNDREVKQSCVKCEETCDPNPELVCTCAAMNKLKQSVLMKYKKRCCESNNS